MHRSKQGALFDHLVGAGEGAVTTSANQERYPCGVAVGTRVTSRPPHRSVRAAFPHTAPTSGVDGSSLPYAIQRL